MNPIVIQDLNHYFGKDKLTKQALFNINLEIKPGEIVIMTGPSGSGKTTLLSLLGGLRRVQSGSLQTLGQELFQAEENTLVNIRRKIGYIFQAHNLLPFMTAQQNVQMSLELEPTLKPRQAAKIAAEMLADVGLKERIQYFPKNLSGGQKQRVAIARALATRPKLVLADEPTAALDSKTGREIVNIMHRLVKEQHSTILLVTHDNRILDIADRIIHMEDGKLVDTEERSRTVSAKPRSHHQQLFNISHNNLEIPDEYLLPVTTTKQEEKPIDSLEHSLQIHRTLLTTEKDKHYHLSEEKNNSSPTNSSLYSAENYNHRQVASSKPPYNIVCIDDSVTVLKSIETFLDNEIFNIIPINNPLDALIATVKNQPDIVLLDIMMPNINGHEFCTLLRQNPKFKNTPIIVITSLNNAVDRELALANGASDYLPKPFNKTDLLKILFKFL